MKTAVVRFDTWFWKCRAGIASTHLSS